MIIEDHLFIQCRDGHKLETHLKPDSIRYERKSSDTQIFEQWIFLAVSLHFQKLRNPVIFRF